MKSTWVLVLLISLLLMLITKNYMCWFVAGWAGSKLWNNKF